MLFVQTGRIMSRIVLMKEKNSIQIMTNEWSTRRKLTKDTHFVVCAHKAIRRGEAAIHSSAS